MGKTKQKLISDLELRVTESKPSDDLQLEHSQLVHWLDVVANSIVPDYLNKKIRKREIINPEYITHAFDLQLTEESSNNIDEGIRHYIDVSPYNIMSLDKDSGITRVSTLTGLRVSRLEDQEQEHRLENLMFAKPSRENLVWYREADRIFIEGYGNSITTAVKLNIAYVPIIDIDSLADTAEVPITDDVLSIILDVVEDMAIRELGGTIDDKINDGDQDQ